MADENEYAYDPAVDQLHAAMSAGFWNPVEASPEMLADFDARIDQMFEARTAQRPRATGTGGAAAPVPVAPPAPAAPASPPAQDWERTLVAVTPALGDADRGGALARVDPYEFCAGPAARRRLRQRLERDHRCRAVLDELLPRLYNATGWGGTLDEYLRMMRDHGARLLASGELPLTAAGGVARGQSRKRARASWLLYHHVLPCDGDPPVWTTSAFWQESPSAETVCWLGMWFHTAAAAAESAAAAAASKALGRPASTPMSP